MLNQSNNVVGKTRMDQVKSGENEGQVKATATKNEAHIILMIRHVTLTFSLSLEIMESHLLHPSLLGSISSAYINSP